jgi:hypothetical protein
MSDALYIVSRDEQDQYVRLLNLEDAGVIFKQRDTLRISSGARQPVYAMSERRRGGARQVSESRDLGSVAATFMVKGDTTDEAIARLEDLLEEADAPGERWLWWEPEGASRVSLYPLVGPAQCTVNYTWPLLMSGFFPCEVTWPAQPWVEGLVQDFSDDFRARDSPAAAAGASHTPLQQFQQDYTTSVVPTSVAQGALELPAGLAEVATSKIARLDREPFQDGWVTLKGKAKTGGATGQYAVTPGIRYTPANGKYFWATLDAGGLQVYEYDGVSANTSRASVAQATPAVGTSYWMRIRGEGTSVTAEYWATRPTPTGTPTNTVTYTNAAAVRTGYPLLNSWGMGAGATRIPILEEFEVRPYSYRLQNTPSTINVEQLPGTMDAASDVDVSPASTDSDYARHILLGWRRRLTGQAAAIGGITTASSLLIPGEQFASAAGSTTPVLATDAVRYRGTSNQAMTVPVLATAGTSMMYAAIDPTIFEADDFSDSVTCAVVARYYRQSGIVTPRIAAAVTNLGAATYNYTPEFGSTGRTLPGATATARVTTTTLGTVTFPRVSQVSYLYLFVSWAAGSTAAQVLGVDEVYLVPVPSLAMSPTDKGRDDGAYPKFAPNLPTGATLHTVRVGSRGRGSLRMDFTTGGPYRFSSVPLGIGGADMNLPIASEGVELLVRPSVSVPDDPVYTTTADILTHNVSVHLRVTPRYRFAA